VPVYAVGLSLFFYMVLISLAVTTAIAQSNPVVLRTTNRTTAWQISDKVSTDKNGADQGYASSPSVNAGTAINFFVTTNPPQTYTMTSIA